MDYNDFELIAAVGLCLIGPLAAVTSAVLLHRRRPDGISHWYLLCGILGSILYGFFAGLMLIELFPPPYVPGLSEGRGLDLRGIILILGSWVGGLLAGLGTMLSFAISQSIQWRRKRKALQDGKLVA
ncbi:hypothetical protein CQ018_11275 [Arthrobacter sp. MYb227]|uniref:hypothetical protein n=1 Tax=Arthrobacter sp. MYb227 TaxID=1848601 RepID=UPI000CFAE465|nr:hypothetical protein [Arthrobacter sp. MYb227]PQZ93026.1 hypothetical protein CQ018_11275 [Arthrobacter sp. MYb227]